MSKKFLSRRREENLKIIGVDVKISLSETNWQKSLISFSNQEEYERIINSLK